jgi:hypothetical protein
MLFRAAVPAIVSLCVCFGLCSIATTSTLALSLGAAGHVSPMTMSGPVNPFNEPRYNLGPGDRGQDGDHGQDGDRCLRKCMEEATGTPRRSRQSCRKSCASNEL